MDIGYSVTRHWHSVNMKLLLQASSNNMSLVNEANVKVSALRNKVSVSLEENEKRPLFSGKNEFLSIFFT